jgi:DNA-binding NarL/FixJ family response regulator
MRKPCVLISGLTIWFTEESLRRLEKSAIILKCLDNREIADFLEKAKVNLVVLEMTSSKFNDLKIIKDIKSKFPQVEIILINGNGDRDILAQAFSLGVRDAFPKTIDHLLLLERIEALLRHF